MTKLANVQFNPKSKLNYKIDVQNQDMIQKINHFKNTILNIQSIKIDNQSKG